MDNQLLKEAFTKVKQDIYLLKQGIESLNLNLNQIKEEILLLSGKIEGILYPTENSQNQTDSTHPSTHNLPPEALKPQNLGISTGNQGVPTDKQTNRQTNRQTEKLDLKPQNSFEGAIEILNSLDSIKREIRLKFKRLTEQEFLVFSTVYQLDEELGYSNYKLLSQRLNLSESSIRDYVGRIIKKGISLDKKRINNKYIRLNVSEKLKKIVTLSTILQLRGI